LERRVLRASQHHGDLAAVPRRQQHRQPP
jgi:hypothetical protein